MIRAFIAVELPDTLRHAVATLQTTLRAAGEVAGRGADVNWVEPVNLHFTLKFLGNIEEARVDVLKKSLAVAARGHASFTMQVEGLGLFPGTRNPRILWVGVTQGQEALTALAQAVEQACGALGVPLEERPFAAHLTIGRIRSPERLVPLIKQLQVAEFRGGPPASVDHLTLFQSVLSSRGSTYRRLATIPLA